MDDLSGQRGSKAALRQLLRQTWQWFASLELAVVLLVIIAAVLAVATLIEAARGSEFAQWHVYKNPWFMALLALLALNISAATLNRWPWRRGRRAFVLTHLGVLCVLAGAMITFSAGVEGQLALQEDQTGDAASLTDRCVLRAMWATQEQRPASVFVFEPGPVDWPEGRTLDLRSVGGVHLEVLKFLRHVRVEEAWVEDSPPGGTPALQLAVAGPDGPPVAQQWLVAGAFGGEAFLGSARIVFQQTARASLLEDFVNPPKDLGTEGVLSVHHEGRMERIPVQGNVGKPIQIGKSDVRVEIASYLPDARKDPAARLTTDSPVLRLSVYLPGKKEPLRQIALAKHPYWSLDGIHGWECPVKFWYHHPAVRPEAGTQFFQTPDAKLHYRVVADGKVVSHGIARKGDRIESGGQMRLSIAKHLPHARQNFTFFPAEASDGGGEESPAVLVRVSAAGQTSDVWLKQADADHGFQQITTPEGKLGIAFGYDRLPLGFALKLVKFRHDLNPGMMGDAAFGSEVRVIDNDRGIDMPAEIAMNQPLVYGGFSFYQSGHDQSNEGRPVSILKVSVDPGRFLKYVGCLAVCGGIFAGYYNRVVSFLLAILMWLASLIRRRRPAASVTATSVAIFTLLALATEATSAADAPAAAFNWSQWQNLPVLEGGRPKPFDTLAAETLRSISGKSSFTDAQSQQRLGPVALYMTLLFNGPCWNPAASAHGIPDMGGCPGQTVAASDAWDREPLLLVDFSALRVLLAMPAEQKYISFYDLSRAVIDVPKTAEKIGFVAWARQLMRERSQKLSRLEKKALALAERYWTYQDVRQGHKLQVLPIEGSKTQQWLSVAMLMQAKWDDKNDPGGLMRKAKEELQKARTAYIANSAECFNTASAGFIAALNEAGPKLGDYPSAGMIDLEVAYNHLAPMHVAWICTLVALLGALLYGLSPWRAFHGIAILAYVAGVLAILTGFGIRTIISERAPVTNMYESVVFMGLGAAIFGAIFQAVYRKRFILWAGTAICTLALVLADFCPTILDPSIRPLTPVLRSNFWLVIHVMTIMLSYAAFALALLVSNVILGFYLFRRANAPAAEVFSKLNYNCLQAGVLLLVIGTFLGAWWADNSWGRFWGWDPKEVWALITLLGYLAFLHARHVGWVSDFGMAAYSVLCFTLILMAWYGVNFVLGTGLHSYGFGGGGQVYVLIAVALQFLYVGVAAVRRGAWTKSPHTCSEQTANTSNAIRSEPLVTERPVTDTV